jgi:hypothetical protein
LVELLSLLSGKTITIDRRDGGKILAACARCADGRVSCKFPDIVSHCRDIRICPKQIYK